jgi:hypothetical protein
VHKHARANGLPINRELREAYSYFYPEESSTFVPDVVDFFSVLRAYEEVSRGYSTDGARRFPGGFRHPALLTDLRLLVMRLLCERVNRVAIPLGGWRSLESMFRPGNIVITSNWDMFVEWYAACRGIPLRLGGEPDGRHLTLIKLHGSVDWTEPRYRPPGKPNEDYSLLNELQNTARTYRMQIKPDTRILRIRALENMSRAYQFIKARTRRPHMIMMSQGKTVDMEPIHEMWDDAYRALSVTRQLQIIGYSLPEDDIEIRTLLRAGVARKGMGQMRVTIVNPDPNVHVRVRTYVDRNAESDFSAFVPR